MPDHLLHPRFFALPPDMPFDVGETFDILWYARADAYTLVRFRKGNPNEPLLREPTENTRVFYATTEGECLYQGDDLVAWAWFGLTLGEPTDLKALIAQRSSDPRARIDQTQGSYGLSPTLAAKLRSTEARITFQFD